MPAKLVMVINDTREILELFEQILTEEGYRVSLHSYNTRELNEVKELMPDLVISDHLVTQEQSGWQFIQKLKMDRQTAKIPIIICTTNRKIVSETEGYLAVKGISVVLKPFDIDELIAAVEEMIGKANEPGSGTTSLNPQNPNPSKN